MRYVSYEDGVGSLSDSETSSSGRTPYVGGGAPIPPAAEAEHAEHERESKSYLKPTISFLSKGAKARPGGVGDCDATGNPPEDRSVLPRANPRRPQDPYLGSQEDSGEDLFRGGRPRSSKGRQEAVRTLKQRGERERVRKKSARSRDRSQAQPRKVGKPQERGKRRAKQVRFQGDDEASNSSRSSRQGPAEADMADPVRTRLWDDAPQSSEDLYSSLAADIRAVFDRAMTGEEAASPPPASAETSRPFEHRDDGGGGDSRLAEEELEKKSAVLRRELQRVEESKMQLELASRQKALRRRAREGLEEYEGALSRQLESRIRSFMEEKERKVAEIRDFKAVIDKKLQMLRQVLGELQQKEEHLETAYAAAIGEIHREYRSAVEARAKALESDVSAELRAMVTEMATRRRGNGLPTSGGSYRDPPEPPAARPRSRGKRSATSAGR